MKLILKPSRNRELQQKGIFRSSHPKVVIDYPDNDLSLQDMIALVFVPALLAIGYPEQTVREYFTTTERYEESERA